MTKKQKDHEIRNIAYTLIWFSLPLIFSGILQQLYNWADAFIVGNVEGELALAAVGATTTLINFYVTAVTGFTLGLAILFAQKSGNGEQSSIAKILSTFSVLLGGIFLLLAGAGMVLTIPLLEFLHTTPDTIRLAGSYLRIVLAGVPFLAVYNVYSAALRGIGDSKAPFYAVLVSSVTNVVLDIVFVVFLRFHVAGAAAATVISQTAMTAFLVGYSIRKYPIFRFSLFRKPVEKEALVLGCRFGIPPMLQSSVSSVGSLILQNFMNGFGTQTVAAVTTAYRIDTIVMLPILNLGSGISTLVAQKYGSGQRKQGKKILAAGTGVMTVVCLVLTGLVIPMGGWLIALFGAGPEAVEIGNRFFQRIAAFYLVFGLATAVRSYLEGMGDVVYSSLAGIASLVFRIAASYLLVSFFANMVIAYAEGFSWILLLFLYIVRAFRKETEAGRCRKSQSL